MHWYHLQHTSFTHPCSTGKTPHYPQDEISQLKKWEEMFSLPEQSRFSINGGNFHAWRASSYQARSKENTEMRKSTFPPMLKGKGVCTHTSQPNLHPAARQGLFAPAQASPTLASIISHNRDAFVHWVLNIDNLAFLSTSLKDPAPTVGHDNNCTLCHITKVNCFLCLRQGNMHTGQRIEQRKEQEKKSSTVGWDTGFLLAKEPWGKWWEVAGQKAGANSEI